MLEPSTDGIGKTRPHKENLLTRLYLKPRLRNINNRPKLHLVTDDSNTNSYSPASPVYSGACPQNGHSYATAVVAVSV